MDTQTWAQIRRLKELDVNKANKIPNNIGVFLNSTGPNQIGASGLRGNIISGNTNYGIQIQSSSGPMQILQNIIGTNYPSFEGGSAGGFDLDVGTIFSINDNLTSSFTIKCPTPPTILPPGQRISPAPF